MVAVAVVAVGGAGAWWLLREASPPPVATKTPAPAERVVGLGKPLPMDETVELRWVDEETGEEDVWKVTKREISPGDQAAAAAPLPEPDPNAGDHVPDESARALQAMGLESWKRGEISEAMAQLAQAVATDPDDPELQTQYGRLQLLAMDYGTARPHLERAAALNPEDPQAWLDLASLYERSRDISRAAAARQRAQELLGDGQIVQDPTSGFWVVEGTNIYP
jgi:hypothetical protein